MTREGEVVWDFYNPDRGPEGRAAIYRLTRIAADLVEPLLGELFMLLFSRREDGSMAGKGPGRFLAKPTTLLSIGWKRWQPVLDRA